MKAPLRVFSVFPAVLSLALVGSLPGEHRHAAGTMGEVGPVVHRHFDIDYSPHDSSTLDGSETDHGANAGTTLTFVTRVKFTPYTSALASSSSFTSPDVPASPAFRATDPVPLRAPPLRLLPSRAPPVQGSFSA